MLISVSFEYTSEKNSVIFRALASVGSVSICITGPPGPQRHLWICRSWVAVTRRELILTDLIAEHSVLGLQPTMRNTFTLWPSANVHTYVCMHIYEYTFMYTHYVTMYIHTYIHIQMTETKVPQNSTYPYCVQGHLIIFYSV